MLDQGWGRGSEGARERGSEEARDRDREKRRPSQWLDSTPVSPNWWWNRKKRSREISVERSVEVDYTLCVTLCTPGLLLMCSVQWTRGKEGEADTSFHLCVFLIPLVVFLIPLVCLSHSTCLSFGMRCVPLPLWQDRQSLMRERQTPHKRQSSLCLMTEWPMSDVWLVVLNTIILSILFFLLVAVAHTHIQNSVSFMGLFCKRDL